MRMPAALRSCAGLMQAPSRLKVWHRLHAKNIQFWCMCILTNQWHGLRCRRNLFGDEQHEHGICKEDRQSEADLFIGRRRKPEGQQRQNAQHQTRYNDVECEVERPTANVYMIPQLGINVGIRLGTGYQFDGGGGYSGKFRRFASSDILAVARHRRVSVAIDRRIWSKSGARIDDDGDVMATQTSPETLVESDR